MNPMRITFLLIISFIFSFPSFSQSDTTCVKTRWISVKNTEHNAVLFDSVLGILVEIRNQVDSKKLPINNDSKYTIPRGRWYPIPEEEHQILKETGDTIYSTYIHDYFEIYQQSDYPMVDEYGDPIIVSLEDGTKCFKYPTGTTHTIRVDEIYEFRIREERAFNEETKKYDGEFRATGMSFCMHSGQLAQERFWINLDLFFDNITSPETFSWYSFLQNRQYIGFQYMQVSCYDDLIRY